jgi:hypothetical protein
MGSCRSNRESRPTTRRRCWQKLVWIALVSALLALTAAPAAWAQSIPTLEYQVKASYLYNFLQFVEWPPEAFPDGVILVCVFGEDHFGAALREIDGEAMRGSTIAVRHVGEPGALEDCHIAFVSASERNREPQVLRHLAGRPVLTVGETSGFTERGGAINLVLMADKVRFKINRAAAERNQLKISAQLLQLGMR